MYELDGTQNQFESDYQEMEYEYDGAQEFEGESYNFSGEFESSLDEVEEMELAANLLEITDEYELDQFLGKLMNKAKKAAGGFLKSSVGKQVGGLLKAGLKHALPTIGGLVGNIALPGIGGMVGSNAASALGGMFGLELEGLSPQDQEFEAAKSLVRLVDEATKIAANAPPNAPPQQIAKAAVIQAAQKHAPGLLTPANGGQNNGQGSGIGRRVQNGARQGAGRRAQSGTWKRLPGNRIILNGV